MSDKLAVYIWRPFNSPEYAVSFAESDSSFSSNNGNHVSQTTATNLKFGNDTNFTIKYFLHPTNKDTPITARFSVVAWEDLCPVFESAPNDNLFEHYFGVKFVNDEHKYVRAISPFEFIKAHKLMDDLVYKLLHPDNKFAMDGAIPGMTSAWILEHVHDQLSNIRDKNTEIFESSNHAAPAAYAQAFMNSAIGVKMPSCKDWLREYSADTETAQLCELVTNPSKINTKTLGKINHNYRGPLRRSQIIIEDDMLVLKDHIHGKGSYIKLQLVPEGLRNIIFIAFHSNPIGGHFNAYCIFHQIKLRFYWPGMYSYITDMCKKCPGCALSNATKRRSSELIYSFPIEAPFKVIHIDGYTAGKHQIFEGDKLYLVVCCGMCTFAVMEPVAKRTSTSFASAITKIMLCFGFSHTVVVDKDSKLLVSAKMHCSFSKLTCTSCRVQIMTPCSVNEYAASLTVAYRSRLTSENQFA